MHLLTHDEDGYLILKAFTDETLPPYAILSFVNQATDEKQVSPGASSIKTIHPACSSGLAVLIKHAQGEDPDLTHFWVQSLCVDQTDPVEANETTNSIWDIHKNAIRCYVHLSDYSISNTGPAMKDRRIEHSKWFNDIWSLPVLLAASHVEFCSVDGTTIGDKISLADNISRSSGLPSDVLSGQKKMSDYTESDKMRWIRDREWICPREEDAVYALLGLFGVKMEVRYGEGRIAAMQRLGSEIKKNIRGMHPSLSLSLSLSLTCDTSSSNKNSSNQQTPSRSSISTLTSTAPYPMEGNPHLSSRKACITCSIAQMRVSIAERVGIMRMDVIRLLMLSRRTDRKRVCAFSVGVVGMRRSFVLGDWKRCKDGRMGNDGSRRLCISWSKRGEKRRLAEIALFHAIQ